MGKEIRAIFLDLGGTFRVVTPNPPYVDAAVRRMAELTGTDMEPHAFHALLDARYDGYRNWALKYMCEAPMDMLWTRWLVPEYDKARITKNAAELTYQYRRAKGERKVVEGGISTVKELHARGYTLGIISDLIGCDEIDEWLDADKLRPYFATVQQSSVTMLRKPHPAIYFLALSEAKALPEHSAFVGDNLKRDIIGAKESMFAATIAVEYAGASPLKLTEENQPTGVITRFDQLLDVFPGAPRINEDALEKRSI
ncbi:MAG: HAD family hydrolase [Christensenellaceae bacterium]|jgi:HAD superfamily hydrolase (TIGR01549 family)|nr:HAD family hydrolase [Christensenellaceae bacterium]